MEVDQHVGNTAESQDSQAILDALKAELGVSSVRTPLLTGHLPHIPQRVQALHGSLDA